MGNKHTPGPWKVDDTIKIKKAKGE